MFNSILVFIAFSTLANFYSLSLNGQVPGQWTWMGGDSTADGQGNIGVKGVPSIYNNPRNLYGACSWTDTSGNFWLFGGIGNDNYQEKNNYNMLWKFNPATDAWTWITGEPYGGAAGIYGMQGVPSEENTPGARAYATSWLDRNNNLWMFGGYGLSDENASYPFGFLNDLWQFNTTTLQWAWIKGSNDAVTQYFPGIYGTLGVPDIANTPCSRWQSCGWTDFTGDLWLFGGYNGSNNLSYYNDLWRYNIQSNSWTWMKGLDTANQVGYEGIIGVENALNLPNARTAFGGWVDSALNLYFFAGYGITNSGISGTLWGLWKFNISTNNWTLLKVSIPAFLTDSVLDCYLIEDLIPTGRSNNNCSWNVNDELFMFGGDAGINTGLGASGDLWKFSLKQQEWIFVKGITAQIEGIYGIQGLSSSSNLPRSRHSSVSWKDKKGNLWMFGGAKFGSTSNYGPIYNDLWRFTPDSLCGLNTNMQVIKETLVEVFPNPASDLLVVNYQINEKANLIIRDIMGKQIKTISVFPNFKKITINTENFIDGTYIVILQTRKERICQKIIIKKMN